MLSKNSLLGKIIRAESDGFKERIKRINWHPSASRLAGPKQSRIALRQLRLRVLLNPVVDDGTFSDPPFAGATLEVVKVASAQECGFGGCGGGGLKSHEAALNCRAIAV